MQNLNRRIKTEINKHYSQVLLPKDVLKKIDLEKKRLLADFDIWIINLKISMHLCKYRQVIGEIEGRKKNFKNIPEVHWKYQSLEIEAIFKLLKKKIFKRKIEITKEGSHNYHSCLFWFNQIYILLEQLLLEIRPDVNAKLNYKDINILRPIQHIIDGFIKFCYLLLLFSQFNQQIPDLLSYISIAERMIPYMKFTYKSSSFIYLQKIRLFKVKILMENCDYLNAIDYIESNINFGFNYIKILSDDNFNVYEFDLSNEKIRKYLSNLTKRRLFNNFNYKELLNRNENSKNKNQILTMANRKHLLALNEEKLKSFENLNELEKSISRRFLKSNKLDVIDENDLTSSISNMSNNSNSTNNNLNNLQLQRTDSIASKQKIKVPKNQTSNGKNSNQIVLDNNRKMNKSISKKKYLRKIYMKNKSIIEDVLNNITLNFYFRGAIFEHVGNIDSALDSYKEVEWLSVKFLTSKFPFFVKYITSLLNCAWNNYNIIYRLKYEKEKIRQRNEIIKSIEFIKKREKIKAQERINKELLSYKSTKLNNNRKLNNFLKNLGDKIYKEEEQRNFNIYSKFSKTKFILSTYQMIDELMSDELRPILKRMKKVDVTKPNDEIQDQIDKALMKKQHELSIKENNSTININTKYNINNNNLNNTKNSTINLKDSISYTLNNTQRNKINLFNQIAPNSIRLKKKIIHRDVDRSISNYQENSNKKISSSCEMSMINYKNSNYKNSNSFRSYNERSFLLKKKLMNQTKIEDEKAYNKLYRTKSYCHNWNSLMISKLSYKIDKVEKFEMNKDCFNKNVIKKKYFLDRYSSKEFNFLKNLLKTKSFLPEVVRPIDDLGLKKIKQDADLSFKVKMELVKSGTDKKNLNNLIKQNINAAKKKKDKNKYSSNGSDTQTDQSENNIAIDNNEKLRQLENDCMELITKRKLLIKKRRQLNSSI